MQVSFTAVHPPYQAPERLLRLHTQVLTLLDVIDVDVNVDSNVLLTCLAPLDRVRLLYTLFLQYVAKNTTLTWTDPFNLPLSCALILRRGSPYFVFTLEVAKGTQNFGTHEN